jgi:hypothetical protein
MPDFNKVPDSNLIPAKTIVVVQVDFRPPGDSFEEYKAGILKPTKARDAYGLDLVYTVLTGPYAKRKLYGYILVEGSTDGQKGMVERNLTILKAMINSAYSLDPADYSPEAMEKRNREFRDFERLRVMIEVGIETSKDGYPPKNILQRVITKDMPAWNNHPPIEQIGPSDSTGRAGAAGSSTPTPAPISKPGWAS